MFGMVDPLAARIREAREARGFTQAKLAAELYARGVEAASGTMVAKIEQGTRGVTAQEADRISAVLGVPLAWLLRGDGDADTSAYSTGYAEGYEAALRSIGTAAERLRAALDGFAREVDE